ncbi:MAG: heme ABC exporter ATP-binding protein CcmA [Acidimicrobiaceae bacterium]|nr:heme ABC exporter ATP-binding protein CcmA [Acidimicrobiaceae bacterium]|tara:strand:+ start:44489 stop:45121 length:633 start_codon:yes stop_codon:yes gene_type:complete
MVFLGQFPALTGATMNIRQGEVVLIKGPNGAGKSTLLRLCAGLLPMRSGTGTVLNFDLRTQRMELRAHIGLLGHRTGLYPDLTVNENLKFWASAYGANNVEIDKAMSFFGLNDRLGSVQVQNLSEGQRRRTSLALLLIKRPSIWLLDEPYAGLDSNGRELVNSCILEATQLGTTVLIASHEIDKIGSTQERTLLVKGGRIVSDNEEDSEG